jgi:hypothetical protein
LSHQHPAVKSILKIKSIICFFTHCKNNISSRRIRKHGHKEESFKFNFIFLLSGNCW